MSISTRRLLLLVAIACALTLAGCMSADRHEFVSTSDRTTIQLIDPVEDVILWEKPVPAAHRLIVDLDRAGEQEFASVSGRPATQLRWKLYSEDEDGGQVDRGRLELDGTQVQLRMKLTDGAAVAP